MKNFKQIAFGLMIGALAIGFSAFTNAKNVNKAKFATVYYGLNHAGTTYAREVADPSDDCTAQSNLKDCTISYPSDQGASFSASSIPAGSTSVSGPGWVNP
ncbi:hypothetical protein [Mucilaginibacter sp.]|jgi:hypothetical protein|uniref:hypothetical protein n=1 Tax=Mucilaginibacter sp. TaxID=1882438 RepID=UPI003D0FEF27